MHMHACLTLCWIRVVAGITMLRTALLIKLQQPRWSNALHRKCLPLICLIKQRPWDVAAVFCMCQAAPLQVAKSGISSGRTQANDPLHSPGQRRHVPPSGPGSSIVLHIMIFCHMLGLSTPPPPPRQTPQEEGARLVCRDTSSLLHNDAHTHNHHW